MTGNSISRRNGIDGIADVERREDTEKCDAINWTRFDQCNHMTHWVCLNCDHRVCGTHAHWHKGDWRSVCSANQVKEHSGLT